MEVEGRGIGKGLKDPPAAALAWCGDTTRG
jgi:hypothetical protein